MKTNPIYYLNGSGLSLGDIYSLTLTSNGNGSVYSVSNIGNNGYTTTLSAVPSAGYQFSAYSADYGTINGNEYTFTTNDAVVSAFFEEQLAPPFPPTGDYKICARLYTSSNLDHITVNTVSWNYDAGSTTTYEDADCTIPLTYLSQWNDSTRNTILPVIGQNEYGTFADIFAAQLNYYYNFCVILGNDRVQTITDDSWIITRVEIFAVGDEHGYYRVNSTPSKGQWFRNNNPDAWVILN